jgi:hypothetical protein
MAAEAPFVVAEIVSPEATDATIRYGTGFNNSGTDQHEVLQRVRHPDGAENLYVIMRGISRTKAAAIAMILNADDEG